MSIWRIEAALPAHIPAIAERMRPSDVHEVWASDRCRPLEALEKSLSASTLAWTCLLEEAPAFMWGVAPKGGLLSGAGTPWLLGTEDVYRLSGAFLRQSRRYVAKMHEYFPRLENRVHAENRLSLRWLKWCGFTIEEDAPLIINQEPFFLFWREMPCARRPQ